MARRRSSIIKRPDTDSPLTPAPMKPTPDATLAATRAWSALEKPNCDTNVNVHAPMATRDLRNDTRRHSNGEGSRKQPRGQGR